MSPSPPHDVADDLPATCSMAFKEWSGVCQALASGRQAIILRKGGIAEDAGRFVPEHAAFWLYPTHLHEAQQGLREGFAAPHPEPSTESLVPISALALVHAVWFIDRPEVLVRLEDLHVWSEDTVLRRFHYRAPGLWVLGVRVLRRPDPWLLEPTPAQAGCKSWVPLEQPIPTEGLRPALEGAEFARRMERLRAEVESAGSLTGGPRA